MSRYIYSNTNNKGLVSKPSRQKRKSKEARAAANDDIQSHPLILRPMARLEFGVAGTFRTPAHTGSCPICPVRFRGKPEQKVK
jgi:hypothetical protein